MLGHVTFVNILIKFKEKLQVNSTPAKIYFSKSTIEAPEKGVINAQS